MRWLEQLRMRIGMLFDRGNRAARLNDELREHLERQTDKNLAAGMNREDARSAAFRAFGNPALIREQARATWSWSGMESLLRDVRYGVRTLGRSRAFALTAIAVMAMGIGANVAMFTIVRPVLLKPLPFSDPDRLMMVYERDVAGDYDAKFHRVAGGMFAEWKRQNKTFQDLALASDAEFNLSASGSQIPEKLDGVNCSWNLLGLLGVKPAERRSLPHTTISWQRTAR